MYQRFHLAHQLGKPGINPENSNCIFRYVAQILPYINRVKSGINTENSYPWISQHDSFSASIIMYIPSVIISMYVLFPGRFITSRAKLSCHPACGCGCDFPMYCGVLFIATDQL